MRKSLFLFSIILHVASMLHCQSLTSQSENIRSDRKFGVHLKIGGAYPMMGGLELDYFLNPKLNIEFDIMHPEILSNVWYNAGGLTYHFWGDRTRNWSPYTGMLAGFAKGRTFISGHKTEAIIINVPLGVGSVLKNGLSFSLDIAASFVYERTSNGIEIHKETAVYPYPGLKIGYRFK